MRFSLAVLSVMLVFGCAEAEHSLRTVDSSAVDQSEVVDLGKNIAAGMGDVSVDVAEKCILVKDVSEGLFASKTKEQKFLIGQFYIAGYNEILESAGVKLSELSEKSYSGSDKVKVFLDCFQNVSNALEAHGLKTNMEFGQ